MVHGAESHATVFEGGAAGPRPPLLPLGACIRARSHQGRVV